MAKMIQNDFSRGEISPVLYGRSDLASYYKGCASAENFVVSKEGTLRKRRGIKTFAEMPLKSSTIKAWKLGSYFYDRTRSLALVFAPNADNALACYGYSKDGSQKFALDTDIAIAGKKEIDSIQLKQIGDQIWVTNGRFFKIFTITHTEETGAFACKVSDWKQASEPEKVANFVATGYSADDVAYTSAGTADIFYCAYIVRDGVMSELVKKTAYQRRQWEAGAYTNCTVTITEEQRDTMDFVCIGKSNGGPTAYGELTRYYKEDFKDSLEITFRDSNISPGNAIFSQTNVLGEGFESPLCADCYQQRRVFANANTGGSSYPMTLWFSEVGNLTNFYSNRPATDADAFSPTIAAIGPAFIRWVCSFQENLILFTDTGLFSVGFSQTAGFSASSCRISRFSQTKVSPDIQPAVSDAGLVFVGADNKTLYTAAYDLQENSLKPINRTVLVEHLTRAKTIVALAIQEYPNNIVWIVLSDGTMASFTYEVNEKVFAWSHSMVQNAKVLDIVAPGTVTDGVGDRSYSDITLVVEKNGTKYLALFDNSYADTIGNVSENVKATLVTLRPESHEKTLTGAKRNIKDVILRVHETGGISVRNFAGEDLPLVEANMPSLFSGDVKVMPRGFIDEIGQMTYVSDNSAPCEILQIVTSMEVVQ